MADDSGAQPLPRRVPGASGSPRATARIERTPIPEDLRQRVLSAIAVELERDRAEQRRNIPHQGGASGWAVAGDPVAQVAVAGEAPGAVQVPGAPPADSTPLADGAALGYGAGPADAEFVAYGAALADDAVLAGGAALADGAAVTDDAAVTGDAALTDGPALADGAALPDNAALADRAAPADGTAPAGGATPAGGAAPGGDPAPADWAALAGETAAADDATPGPAASLADGVTFAYGVPPPDGDVAPEGEAAVNGPAITDGAAPASGSSLAGGATFAYGVVPEPGTVPGGERAEETAEPEAEAPWPAVPLPRRAPGENGAPPPPAHIRREYLPPSLLGRRLDPEAHTEPIPKISGIRPDGLISRHGDKPASQSAEPPWAAAPSATVTPATPADVLPSGARPALPLPGPPAAAPEAAGPAPDVFTAPAQQAGPAPDVFTAPAQQAGPAPSARPAPPGPAAPGPAEPPSAGMPAPGPSAPALAPYSWPSGPGAARPGNGAATVRPAARPVAQAPARPQRPGRWRIAGLILAVLALVVAGAIALLSSGHDARAGHSTGSGSAGGGAGAAVRNQAAAWVAGQVSRTAVVACDPVMCQALRAQGVPAPSLYQLGRQTITPVHSQVIVATAAVRAQFGSLLGSVYAPAVLASFGAGPDRIDVRQTAQHGAGAYRAMARADLASRRASGAEVLHSSRIAVTFAARRQLAAGNVDPRLLIAIAQMAATHPMYIVDFGHHAPGAGPDVPLRQADLAEDAHARHHPGHAASPGYVRSMVTFLHAQHGEFRPAYVRTVHLPGGAAVLRIEFTAPSPLGLLGPRA